MFDSEPEHDLIERGLAAAAANQRPEARILLERALNAGPSLRDQIRAWRCLGEISETDAEKRAFLEKVLVADPSDGSARRALAILDGRLDPGEVIDPNARDRSGNRESLHMDARRFVCSQCGSGRVVFDLERQLVVCEHCRHPAPPDVHARGEDNDFVAALWTARGHRVPSPTNVFSCKGCGATFLVAPAALSTDCPYCASVHVGESEPRDLIQPDGIIPFAISQSDAQATAGAGVTIRGVYLPVWTFTFAGEASWKATRRAREWSSDDVREEVSGTYAVIDLRTLVPATDRLPSGSLSAEALDGFDLDASTTYQPALLAGWPAETYEVSLEAAAQRARTVALPRLRAEVKDYIDDDVEDLQVSAARVAIDSFKLMLLPFWLTYFGAGTKLGGFVNGQTRAVHVESRRSSLAKWFASLVGRDQ